MSELVIRNFQASDIDAVINLSKSISKRNYNLVFWWPGEEKWMWEYVFCAFNQNKLIAKGQVRPINIVTETSDPNAKHTIFLNIKIHPDWEAESEVFDVLYRKLVDKANCIKSRLPASRGTKLCVGNDSSEVTNTQYYIQKGFTHFNSLYWMKRDLEHPIHPVPKPHPELEIRHWEMETEEEEQQYLEVEQAVFKDKADGLKRLREHKSNPNWSAIAAFHHGEIIGHLMVWKNEQSKGVIESVLVKPSWRKQGVARFLLTEGLMYLNALGLSTAELAVLVDNDRALQLYTSVGFEVQTEERRYWTDLE